jgi:hypothetical protein
LSHVLIDKPILMKYFFLFFAAALNINLFAQVDNTMYGLHQMIDPPAFQFASIDPLTGQITAIGSAVLSNTVNATGSALNPYDQTFSYQDEDSWISLDLQTGAIVSNTEVALPNTSGYFDNFRFNAADSNMYGLFRQVIYDPVTGFVTSDIRLATCDLSSGMVDLISPNSIAESFTMKGSTIDPFLMVYYFETEGKFMGLDLYNGQIYSEPTVSIPGGGSSFDNFAYSCADTAVYGLIMDNGVKALGKIDPQTGVVTALPTYLNFDNYVMNSGGAIDPENLVYYFQTMDTTGQIKLVGLSLLDGSVASESCISSSGGYFIMYRIQSDCYRANRARLNVITNQKDSKGFQVQVYPNPAQETLHLSAATPLHQVEILDVFGKSVQLFSPNKSSVQIPLDFLNSGLYYLRIRSNNTHYSSRFIKN